MAITSILLFFLMYLNQIKINKKIYLIDIEFIPVSMFILMAVNFLTLFISINIRNLEIVGTDFFPIFMLTASFIIFTLIIQMKKNNFYLLYYSIVIWALIIVYFDIIHIIVSQILNYDYARMHSIGDYKINRLPDLFFPILVGFISPLINTENKILKFIMLFTIIISFIIGFTSIWKTLMLSSILGLFLIIILEFKLIFRILKRYKYYLIAITGLLIFIISIFFQENLVTFWKIFELRIIISLDLNESASRTFTTRVTDWKDTITLVRENFPLGDGFGQKVLGRTNNEIFYLADTSNYFLRILGYFGPIGIIYPILLIHIILMSLVNSIQTNKKEDKKIMYSILISSICTIPILIAFPSLVYFPVSMLLGINSAFLYTFNKKPRFFLLN
jgi:hypothetical protein